MRDLMLAATRPADVPVPGLDAVSINVAREIGRWAASDEPDWLHWALESGATQMEGSADALERSLATCRDTDQTNAAQLRYPKDLAGTPSCALLTLARLAASQMDLPGQPKDVLDAAGCEWDNTARTREMILADRAVRGMGAAQQGVAAGEDYQ